MPFPLPLDDFGDLISIPLIHGYLPGLSSIGKDNISCMVKLSDVQLAHGFVERGPDLVCGRTNQLLVTEEYFELRRRLAPVTGQPELGSPRADWEEVIKSTIDPASEGRVALRAN